MTRAKERLVELKNDLSMMLKLVPTNMTLAISKAWEKSVSRKDFNRKIIVESDWCPRDRMLLNHLEIQSAIAPDENLEESNVPSCCK